VVHKVWSACLRCVGDAKGSGALSLGVRVYGFGAIALAVVGFFWGDFADQWQPIQAFGDHIAYRGVMAEVAAVLLFAGGELILWRRTGKAGALLLLVLYLVFAAFWVPRVVRFPLLFGTWAGLAGQVYLAMPGAIVLGKTRTAIVVAGLCSIALGVGHFTSIPQTAAMVPTWMPFGGTFWAIVTGTGFVLAGIATITGLLSLLAARLLAAMFVVLGVAVWLPALALHPHAHNAYAGCAISIAYVGAALAIAEAVAPFDSGASRLRSG
jgi:uncharacterized membrane protein